MTFPVGHLVNHFTGLQGEAGLAYNYILANNGLWLAAQNDHLKAQLLLASAEVRGLNPLIPVLELQHGRILAWYWEAALAMLGAGYRRQESFVAITWENGRYHVVQPSQEVTAASVRYSPPQNAVLELHTHPGMRPFFSSTDDRDEQGFRIYGVLGWRDGRLQVRLRLGMYGCFWDVPWATSFQGRLQDGWQDAGIYDAEEVTLVDGQ